MAGVSASEVKSNLEDISDEITVVVNTSENGISIKAMSEKYFGSYVKGSAFYELTKREPHVQDYKLFCIRDKKTNKVYTGVAARDILGLPRYGEISLNVGQNSDYDIFVQSTSVNRKIPLNTKLLVWLKARAM
jgi:hypothetical protein